jgi:hypothetical protein
MWSFIKWLFYAFSPYVDSFERKVDKFFQNIKSSDNVFSVQKELLEFMQKDLVKVNVWLEKKFKGYKYLTKSVRREMYKNTSLIVLKFNKFCREISISESNLKLELDSKGLIYPSGNTEQLKYLAYICAFLKPGLYYEYIKTSSFGKLLKNPAEQKLQGDCNQIVTLYAYLYSLKFPINDLQIKLLHEHVCLHFRGVDIEATAGVFIKYPKYEHLIPVTEIISTNLLDLSDFRESTQKIDERTMVKSAQLAYAISSLKSFVAQNLEIAYFNLSISAMKNGDLQTAVFYASKTKNAELKEQVEKMQFVKRFNELVTKTANAKTIDDAKKQKSSYTEMLVLARKLGDDKAVSKISEILKQI